MNTAPSPARYAWFVVALLFPVALLNYLDRQMIAAMKGSVMHSVTGITLDSQWGYMLGQFKWVYAFFSPVGGYVADRFSRRWAICSSLLVWSVITWLTGHVTTYEGLLWTRTAMGLSEAFYIPAALALISDYHRGPTRSRATGIHQMGIYCGVILGGFAGYAADAPDIGWRYAFNFTGLAGVLYAIPLFLLLRDPQRTSAEGRSSAATSLRELLATPSFLLLVLYFTLPALAGWVVRDWMPAILQQSFNISQGLAGVSATLYWQAAAIVAALGGGWLADRLMRHTDRGRIYVSALGMALIIPALFGVGNSPALGSFGLAIMSLVVFGIGWGFFDSNNMPILCQIARPGLRATGYGIMNFVSISCGGFADWGFGAMRDRGIPLNAIFGVFAAACIISVALVLLIRPRLTEQP
jgi:MFS transporter, Spinster family, sphingosine-1-phosphate transporter